MQALHGTHFFVPSSEILVSCLIRGRFPLNFFVSNIFKMSIFQGRGPVSHKHESSPVKNNGRNQRNQRNQRKVIRNGTKLVGIQNVKSGKIVLGSGGSAVVRPATRLEALQLTLTAWTASFCRLEKPALSIHLTCTSLTLTIRHPQRKGGAILARPILLQRSHVK